MKLIEIIDKYIDLQIKFKAIEELKKETLANNNREPSNADESSLKDYKSLADQINSELTKVNEYYHSLVESLNVEDLIRLKAELDAKAKEYKEEKETLPVQIADLKAKADKCLEKVGTTELTEEDIEENIKLNGQAFEKENRLNYLEEAIKNYEGFSSNLQGKINLNPESEGKSPGTLN